MTATDSISNIYELHHKKNRKKDFSLFEKERGTFIQKIIESQKWLEILDIGCRDGNLTKYFDTTINHITWVDIDTNALSVAKSLWVNGEYMDLNADWGVLGEKTYDVVWAFEIIEHLYFPEVVLDKISKKLNSTGIFIGSVPNAFSLPNRLRLLFWRKKWTPLSDPTHINQFSYHEFRDLLEKRFKKVEVYWLVDQKWMWLAKINPNLFSYMLVWKCEK